MKSWAGPPPMYNILNHDKNQRPILNSYLPGINISVFPKKDSENKFSEILVNELHYWIEHYPDVIHSPNV